MTYAADVSGRTYPALMEVSRVIACHGDVAELFDKLAECLRPLLGFHYLSVALHDDKRQVMRLHVLHSSLQDAPAAGLEFPVGQSPAGEVWSSQQVRNFSSQDQLRHYHASSYELLLQHGVQSLCVVPLTTAHR